MQDVNKCQNINKAPSLIIQYSHVELLELLIQNLVLKIITHLFITRRVVNHLVHNPITDCKSAIFWCVLVPMRLQTCPQIFLSAYICLRKMSKLFNFHPMASCISGISNKLYSSRWNAIYC